MDRKCVLNIDIGNFINFYFYKKEVDVQPLELNIV